MIIWGLILELLPDKHILLVDGITFSKRLCNSRKQMSELIVAVNIGWVLLNGILNLDYSRIFTSLRVENTNTIYILDGEVDVLEYLLALTASSKGIDRNGHAYEYRGKCYDDI